MESGLPLIRHPAQGFNASQQLIRSDRGSMLTMSDDNVMMKQIVGTHAPDGREVDVKPLLHLVEDILKRATQQIDTSLTTSQAHAEMEDKTHQVNFVSMLDALSYTIDRISCEIAYKALGGTDAHATTVSLFNMLTSYSWDAKLVLTLSAFALNYGEFWLLAQIYSSNQLAKSMAILRQLPSIMEHSGPLKPRFDAINNLIKVMMDVARCVVEFKDLPPAYISNEVPALSTAMAHIPTAVYWTMRSVVACAAQITSLTTMGHEFSMSTNVAWELSTLAHKLSNILDHLRKQLDTCYQYIDEKRNVESFQMLKNLFEMIHIDNMKVLKALIYAKDDIQPLIDGSSKKRVHLDVLRRKNVLLLISALDMSNDELSILEQIYNESRHQGARLNSQYEVVWVPIVDRSVQWSDPMKGKFESMQSSMPWFTVYHPSLIEKAVIRFIKEVWHFRNKPILVVLDPQGKVVCPNALHMMWIWGSNAFPFTSLREESLWKDETWRLELLVDGIDPEILNWIKEGKYIFLYGGDDEEWARKFTNTARAVAQAARIPLEMVYVGKSSKREKIRRVIATITVEKLSYVWQDLTMIWFFWTRLESMLYSKIQLGKLDDHDPMMQEIKKLLSYDREGGWAVLSNGSNVVANGHKTTALQTLLEYDLWKEQVPVKGFDLAFRDHQGRIHDISRPCCRFDFPMTTGRIPGTMKCPECNRTMEKFSTFLCCHDEVIPDELFK
ncbi:protein SIEVE ELEMENT OCCLUSION B-like [Populus alba]|uniref:Protein SIEVE ELEMENT OCCLUSION B-like n=1 Tax=Populus alba x Populus x berolinensis TaxID=444605 RepID=A0AAD6RSZ0_9ROSI|nr:protein SIEVE ELEMENT OCCLUSION B-like [Populus alba]KAJ7013975.1 protein SIEVE ELEMENT OCCLUSION B-like [Populus alba x Populus x berolinensis]